MKKRMIFFIIAVIFIIVIYLKKSESVYLFQISNINSLNKCVNKFVYYNENGKIIKEEKFNDIGDISYNYVFLDYIYSFGPGGLYETNYKKMETKKISDEDVNILKFYDNNMYYYVNNGYDSNGYAGKIYGENKVLQLNFFVVDFAVINNDYYILGFDSLYIFNKNNEFVKNIDLTNLKVYQKILEIDNRAFLLNKNSFYEIKNKDIELFDDNNIIRDLNFEYYNNKYIFDNDTNNIYSISLKDREILLEEITNLSPDVRIFHDFVSDNKMQININYDNKCLKIYDLDKSLISKFNLKISKDEAIFNIYRLK